MDQTKPTTAPIQRAEIEDIRARNPIEQVIGSYLELRRAGRLWRAVCPFHGDKDPSLVVYVQGQRWWCYGCAQGGDVFQFIEKIENISFREAVARLGGGTLPRRRPMPPPLPEAGPPQRELGEEHFTLLTAAVEVYHAALLQQPTQLAYLARRGFDLDAVRQFRLGYAAGDNLEKYFRFRGWDQQAGLDLGLLVERDGTVREYFNQRLIIPEVRERRAIYLVGRATQAWQKAKYLGLAGAPKPLCGGAAIAQAHEVFVVEGPFDLLTLLQWGYPAVATLGHPKRQHRDELAHVQRIYIATDADAAGRKFAATLADFFGPRARVLPPLSGVKDVNELSQQHPQDGRDIFARMVRYAESGKQTGPLSLPTR